MAYGDEGWAGLEEATPKDFKRLATAHFAIEADESECFRATFNTPAGQRCLDLLHRRYVDQPRFDPTAANPMYEGWLKEGAAEVVRMLEAKSNPETGE